MFLGRFPGFKKYFLFENIVFDVKDKPLVVYLNFLRSKIKFCLQKYLIQMFISSQFLFNLLSFFSTRSNVFFQQETIKFT